jgi:Fibronectin type III domain
VSWSNAPTRGALLNSLGSVASNQVVTVDVTKGAALDGEVSFRVGSSANDGVRYWSREAATAGNRPQLTVVCATSAPAPDTTAPTAPANLTAKAASSGEIGLQWTASSDNVGVTGYVVYRAGARLGEVSADALTYQDTSDVRPATSYSYTVAAVDAAGNQSPPSNSASATTPAGTGPAAPTGLAATAVSGSEVSLAWTPSSSPTVTGYNIYRGAPGGPLAKRSSTAGSPFQDTTVAAGTAYS